LNPPRIKDDGKLKYIRVVMLSENDGQEQTRLCNGFGLVSGIFV
jgi:hypothetical protein